MTGSESEFKLGQAYEVYFTALHLRTRCLPAMSINGDYRNSCQVLTLLEFNLNSIHLNSSCVQVGSIMIDSLTVDSLFWLIPHSWLYMYDCMGHYVNRRLIDCCMRDGLTEGVTQSSAFSSFQSISSIAFIHTFSHSITYIHTYLHARRRKLKWDQHYQKRCDINKGASGMLRI